LAVLATILGNRLKISGALMEILVGVAAGAAAARFLGEGFFALDAEWVRLLASIGAVLLTFLAGAELEPGVMRRKLGEVSAVGFVGFLAPFLGCAAAARWLLGWETPASLLAGVALSTTSMAVVYAVLFDTGLNRTDYGKGVLGACFVNDLGTVLALGVIFAPFTYRTAVFVAASTAVLVLLPRATRRLTRQYAFRTAAIRTKWILLVLFGLGALALWAGSEPVLPAYLAGMTLAGAAEEDPQWIRRVRTLTVGFLTPIYFIRAGLLVSVPALAAAPAVFLVLLLSKVATKIVGLYPVVAAFRTERRERAFYTLLMSTGLTFGTISALFGLAHGIVSRQQYSYLVAAVIASAVVPTLVAQTFFLPGHLLPEEEWSGRRVARAEAEAKAATPEDDAGEE
jgi:Kef-type K+ transport system membrane component KefB